MGDNCNNNRRCDPIENEARDLARKLDTGRMTDNVAASLRDDSYNMSPREFNRLVNLMHAYDNKRMGDNIANDRFGNLIIDKGRGEAFVVATRDYDEQQRWANNNHRYDDRHDHRHDDRYDDRYGRGYPNNGRDAITDGVVNGAIGAATGAAIDGKKGAIAGAAGGIGNVVVDRVGGPNNRDPVTDVVVKGVIGAGIGAAIDGKKGAIAGGAGSVVPNIVDQIFNRR